MRRFLAGLLLATLAGCGCIDGPLTPGDGDFQEWESCSMTCVRPEPKCRCSDCCPCWERDKDGNRIHRTKKEATAPESR